MKSLYKILLLLLIPLVSLANHDKFKGKYTKEKTVTKEFAVNSNAHLEINNRYGNINVTTWKENTTSLEIIIKTNGDSKERVQERLDQITIDIQGSNNKVSATTQFGDKTSSWGWNNSNKKSVATEINYFIKIPETNTVDLHNKYGAITLDDLLGNATIENKYGQITIGSLAGTKNNISIKYVKTASIKFMESGTIYAGYSDFILEGANNLELEASYTTSELGAIGNLNYTNKYGKLKVDTVTNVVGNAGYNNGTFGTISGNSDFNVKYSNIIIDQLSSTAKNLAFDGKYSKISMGLDNDYAFNFNINHRYGSLSGKDQVTITSQDSKRQSGSYQGYYNNQNSGNKIDITTSYGKVIFK